MSLQLRNIQVHVLPMRARLPFRYGIATLTALPHLMMQVEVDVDGKIAQGISADGFPPKWFTKDPQTTFHQDFLDMVATLRAAIDMAREIGPADSVFALWLELYERQRQWACDRSYPALLWGFAVAMVERALLSAFCGSKQISFAQALRSDSLAINLGRLRPSLSGAAAKDLLPADPLRRVIVRHTIGLADPIAASDIAEQDRVDDGLPQSLEESIGYYGLTHFKIKLSGDPGVDSDRLRDLAKVITRNCENFKFTVDGNETFTSLEAFADLWNKLIADESLRTFWPGLLYVEQPVHRSVAFADEQRRTFAQWADAPAIIIDESDDELDSLVMALEAGYSGTSHKNCKGVFKSVVNACHLEQLRRSGHRGPLLLSAEDLCCVGPVALLQDLAVAANLGLEHIERNGQHYMRGASMWDDVVQDELLASHADLYRRHERGFGTLDIQAGTINVGSLLDAPFGVGFHLDPARFTPLDEWDFASLT